MFGWLTGTIAGPVLGAGLIILAAAFAFTWSTQRWEISRLTTENAKLTSQINDPSTGLLAKNIQCETNVATVSAGLASVNGQIDQLAKDTKTANDNAATMIAAAAAQVRGVKTATDKLLALPATAPIGSLDACRAGARILKTGAP